MNTQLPEDVRRRMIDRLANPNPYDSSTPFNPDFSGRIWMKIEDFIAEELQLQQESMENKIRYRCLLFGCVFGIPHIDKKPKDNCIFCGEPVPDRSDFWGESIESINKKE